MTSNSAGFLNAFIPRSSTASPAQRDASTVRSRTRRRPSFNDDDSNNDDAGHGELDLSSRYESALSSGASTPRSRHAAPSPHPSRQISPLPMRHPSRASRPLDRDGRQKRDPTPMGGLSLAGSRQLNLAETSRAAVDLLDASWSSLQGLASSVLGSDTKRTATSNGTAKNHTRRKPSWTDSYLRSTPRSLAPSSWGPSGRATPEIGGGSQEERLALLQAKKREALLLADTDSVSDLASRHKRRDSVDRSDQTTIDPEQDTGALVYIHHVQGNDTISGVTIRYGCQPAIFRKANGFWPSDSIQSRKTVLLPVGSCSVKGRPIPPAERKDLGNIHAAKDSSEDLSASSIAPVTVQTTEAPSNGDIPSNKKSENERDQIWKHESWVQIDGFPSPVEIGRVPRRTLGFFPRTRRKSLLHTDSESPPPSVRDPTIHQPLAQSSEPQPSSITVPKIRLDADMRQTTSRSGVRHQRNRSSFHLSGPGVGTLDRDVVAPGPAPDKLNQFFAQHMPNLAPSATDLQSQTASPVSTPTSIASTPLDNLGGMLECWVRKVAMRAKTNINEWQQQAQLSTGRSHVPGFDDGVLGGDLIELDSGLDARHNNRAAAMDTVAGRDSSLTRPVGLRQASSSTVLRGRYHSPSVPTSGTRGSDVRVGLKDD